MANWNSADDLPLSLQTTQKDDGIHHQNWNDFTVLQTSKRRNPPDLPTHLICVRAPVMRSVDKTVPRLYRW